MSASSSQSDNDKLEEFFKDVENLTIHSNDCNGDAEDAIIYRQEGSQAKASKRGVMSRAEVGQNAWQDFLGTAPPNSRRTLETTQQRPLVSFSLPKTKGKKPKSKKASDKEQHMPPLPPLALQRPRWIAVLDTCAAIESYQTICDLIVEATRADPREIGVEGITVVIPYRMWDELDYRSKKAGEEGYRERRALRMLNHELENEGRNKLIKSADAVIRAQSRAEMGKANHDFLTTDDGAMDANNDDSILSCALAEQRRLLAESVGSDVRTSGDKVVLLTFDKVLSGKARADGVTPYTPADFVEYYRQRAASLRQRTRLMRAGPDMECRNPLP